MGLSIPLVWSDDHRLHEPDAEIWVGVITPAAEIPARAEAIREALVAAGAGVIPAVRHEDASIEAVHDPALLAFLGSAWRDWEAAGLPDDPGQDRVVPYIFPHPGLIGPLAPLVPAATWARPGLSASASTHNEDRATGRRTERGYGVGLMDFKGARSRIGSQWGESRGWLDAAAGEVDVS